MNYPENAILLFEQGFNCAQAVFSTYAPDLGLDARTALRIASGFGRGMGRMDEVCGAVTGAFMIIGLKYGITNVDDESSTEKAYELVKEFSKRFKKLHGSIICRDLIGCDISTKQGLKHARDNCLFEECSRYVETTVRIVKGLLDERKPRSSC